MKSRHGRREFILGGLGLTGLLAARGATEGGKVMLVKGLYRLATGEVVRLA